MGPAEGCDATERICSSSLSVLHVKSHSFVSFLKSFLHHLIGSVVNMATAYKGSTAVELTEAQGSSSPVGAKAFVETVSNVPERYRGTSADQHDMSVMGKKQVLRVRLSRIVSDHFLSFHSETSVSLQCWDLHQPASLAGRVYSRKFGLV